MRQIPIINVLMRKIFLILSIVFLLLFPAQSLAAQRIITPRIPCPHNLFFPCRNEVQDMISKALHPLQTALSAIQTRVTTIEQEFSLLTANLSTTNNNLSKDELTIKNQSDQIATLQKTVNSQAGTISSLGAMLQKPTTVQVFSSQNLITNIGQESSVFDTQTYRQLVFDIDPIQGQGGLDVDYSNDKSTWTTQDHMTVSAVHSDHAQRIFPILGRYYKLVFTGGSAPFQTQISVTLF